MKKSDLIPGKHAIVMRDGWVGLFLGEFFMGETLHIGLNYYTDDLLDRFGDSENDIMKVLLIENYTVFSEIADCNTLWEREEVKEVTMAEIEEKFGCKVKIIEED